MAKKVERCITLDLGFYKNSISFMNKSICIGIISQGEIRVETMYSIVQAIKSLEIPSSMVIITGCYLARNRNEMFEKSIATGASHTMSIDTDMNFPIDAVERLLAHDKDIVGANYNKRQLPITPIIKDLGLELQEVEFTPGGFMLVRNEILAKIPKPWFDTPIIDNKFTDDDKYFATKAKQAGFKVWCDPTIKVGHIGTMQF